MDSTKLVQEFIDGFLKGCHDACGETSSLGYHVMFDRGTVLKIEFVCSGKPSNDEGTEWNGALDKVDFPTHRLKDGAMKDISEQLEWLGHALDKDIQDKDILRVLKKAIGILISDGYPYPGGAPADRVPIPLPLPSTDSSDDDDDGKTACLVMWPHRHMAILSFVSSDMMEGSVQKAVAVAGEARRLDGFMFFPFAVIGPDLKVTKISLPTFDALKEAKKINLKQP